MEKEKKDKESREELQNRMLYLEMEIESYIYSQSDPGAVMYLRSLKRELEAIKKKLGLKE